MHEPGRTDAGAAPVTTRRAVLRAAVLGGFAAALAACLPARQPGPSARPAGSASPEPTGSPGPTVSPAPSPVPTPTAIPTADLRDLVAGLIVVGFRGTTLDDVPWVRAALSDGGLGGVILFDRDGVTGGRRNVVSPRQVTTLVAHLRAAAGDRRILVGIDQEGGRVTRLSPAHGFPALASEARIGSGSAAKAVAWAKGLVETLVAAGIDLNLAPVVDLDVNPASPAVGALDRSFSADPDVVTAMATIEIDAHRAAGVLTTLKHFPGLGSSTSNTDFGVADVTKTWTRREVEPFRRLIESGKADLVMAGHLVNRKLDADRPASLSHKIVTGLLRDELGWDGVVITDDLGAAAINGTFDRGEAAVLALEAGNDLLLYANQQPYDKKLVPAIVDAVAGAVTSGRLPLARLREAASRVAALHGP